MNIAVIGTGYVGLVTGTCFAESGNDVICVDINADRIKKLKKGKVPFFEPGLEELVLRNAQNGRLSFTTEAKPAVEASDVIMIAVGTPTSDDGKPELRFVIKAAQDIAKAMNGPKIVVIKSTVPIGTSKKIGTILKEMSQYDAQIISNPEFLKEGTAVSDFLGPERVVIGGTDRGAIQTITDLHEPFIRSGNPVLVMDNMSAELSKYACNAFLAMKISFINEVANLSETVGANIESVRKVLMTDSRIGKKFLYPGTGYGGSCFGKDVRALLATSIEKNCTFEILKAVEDVNNRQKAILYEKALRTFKGELKGKTLSLWGLSFKPNTDDIREAPSLVVIRKLLEKGAKVRVYDPIANENVRKLFEDKITYCKDAYSCLEGAEALLILTEWNEFRKPNFKKMKSLLKKPIVLDGRNLFSPSLMKEQGFEYEGIGLQ